MRMPCLLLVFTLLLVSLSGADRTQTANFYLNVSADHNPVSYSVNEFNTTNIEETLVFPSAGYDLSLGFLLPKEADVSSAVMNVSGLSAWTQKTSSPTGVQQHSCVPIGDNFYCVGGLGGGNYFYNTSVSNWTQKTTSPTSLNQHSCVSIGDNFYCVGGINAGNYTYFYNTSSDTWTQKTDYPLIVGGHSCVSIENNFYCMGGDDGLFIYRNETYFYNISSDTWTQKADYPLSISDLSCVQSEDNFYCVGGINAGNYTYFYNISSDTWTQKADYPLSISDLSCVQSEDNFYCIAGLGADRNETYFYNTSSDTWTVKIDYPQRIYEHSCVSPGDKVYCVGGVDVFASPSRINKTYIYNSILLSNVVLLTDSSTIFNYPGTFETENQTADFFSILDSSLSVCSPDADGSCVLPLNSSSDSAGNMTFDSLSMSFNYNSSYLYGISTTWDKTNEIEIDEAINKTSIISATASNASEEVSLTGLEAAGASACAVNGTGYTITSDRCIYAVRLSQGDNFPNLNYALTYTPVTSSTTLTKNTQTEWEMNTTVTSEDEFTNVTVPISVGYQVSDEYLKVIWNETEYDITPLSSTSDCNSGSPTYADKYAGADLFKVCKQDTTGDGYIDYFKALQPHTSTADYLYGGTKAEAGSSPPGGGGGGGGGITIPMDVEAIAWFKDLVNVQPNTNTTVKLCNLYVTALSPQLESNDSAITFEKPYTTIEPQFCENITIFIGNVSDREVTLIADIDKHSDKMQVIISKEIIPIGPTGFVPIGMTGSTIITVLGVLTVAGISIWYFFLRGGAALAAF